MEQENLNDTLVSELFQKKWAVVTATKVVRMNLTYAQARILIDKQNINPYDGHYHN